VQTFAAAARSTQTRPSFTLTREVRFRPEGTFSLHRTMEDEKRLREKADALRLEPTSPTQ
jgi:hypothetical protein